MILKRLINPSVTSNEKYSYYNINSLSINTVKEILSNSFIDGVFGVEAFRVSNRENYTFFSPPNYKVEWDKEVDNLELSYEVISKNENITFGEMITAKSSLFPVEMNLHESIWKIICSICPSHIDIMYQILLVFRQDNWKERLHDQYEDYLNGVQSPSNYGFLRKIQRGINEKLDSFLKWENKHSEIEEIERKLEENGYRYNIRFVLSGGNKREHKVLIKTIENKINKFSYTNQWLIDTNSSSETVDNITKRKLDYNSKHYVLATSELLPFIMINEGEQIEKINPLNTVQLGVNTPENDIMKLLPLGNRLTELNGKLIADKFIASLKEVKKFNEEIVIKQSRTGSTLMKITFGLPDDLRLSELNKATVVNDIQMKMGVKQLQLKQGDGVGEIDILLPLEKRQKVLLRNYIDTDEFKQYSKENPLAFLVGVNEVGEPIFSCISKAKHLLVAGTTGSGKSVWLNQLILTLLTTKNPSDVLFYMIDIKQVELTVFENFPHVQSVVTDTNEGIKLLNQLNIEMNRRYELFKKYNVKNIALYNNQSNNKLPYIICVIDEYAELSSKDNRVHDHVTSLSQLARAAGIHLIIATQRPSADVIPSLIKSNLPSKIGFYCSNTRTYLTFLNTKPPYELLGSGDGTMCLEGQMEEHIRFQGCLMVDDPNDEGLEGKLIRRIASKITKKKVNIYLPEVEEVFEENQLDRLKKIIANTRETRVSSLRNLMKININKLNDLMKNLVEEGWLEAPKTKQTGYRLIKSEEDLEKWRS